MKMVTTVGLVALLMTGFSFLAISMWACIRRLKKTKNSDLLVVVWTLARIVFCVIVLVLALNEQILHADFYTLMPTMVLVYETVSLHLIRAYTDKTIKFDKVYAHMSQTGLLAVVSFAVPEQQWLFGLWSVFALTIVDASTIASTISLPDKNETENETDA